MLNLEVKTKLAPEAVVQRLKKFFGTGGLGLEITDEGPFCLKFAGAGGHVDTTLCVEEGKTKVNIVTQEWEYQAKEFAATLK